MQPLTPQDVQQALDAFHLDVQIRYFDESTATSELAAAAIGCELGQIAKSICFVVDGSPVLVVTSGDQKVDDKKLAAVCEVGRKKVKMARPQQCIEIFGYAPGGVPPVGHRTADIRIYLDEQLRRYDVVYAAAGAPNTIFPLTLDQLQTITGGTFIDVVRT